VAIIVSFGGKIPRIASTAFIAENAVLVGDVEIGEDSSIWFGTVVRGDFAPIRIGKRCNIQDNVVAHADSQETGLVLEDEATVGHSAVLHGVRIGTGSLIGMGAILLSGSIVGAHSMVAAGSVLREGCRIPDDCLAAGNPAVVKGPLRGKAAAWTKTGADEYVNLASRYRSRQL
jgi:carbonic anhydrase/acetyltransferase-like protein (isoleucine patch superfamily)